MERGLTKKDMQKMTVGEIVDFVEDWNERQKQDEEREKNKKMVKKYRLATPKETSEFNRS